MYKQFCKNLQHYLDINKSDSYRYKIAKEIEILTDVTRFASLNKNRNIEYVKISNFIYEMKKSESEYPFLTKFLWELWAYGFDIESYDIGEADTALIEEDIKEKIKLIQLLLGTHYWH